jgi:hypothetical protein
VHEERKQWKEEVKWFEDFPWKKANRAVLGVKEDFVWLKKHVMFPFDSQEIDKHF